MNEDRFVFIREIFIFKISSIIRTLHKLLKRIMKFKELINKRYSVRNYKDKKVDRQTLAQIVEAGQLAPSACNKQPWRFLVVDEPDLLERIHSVYNRAWFQSAPAVIIAYGNREEAWVREFDGKNYCDIDLAIAVDHMSLMAADLGVGSCWICHFEPDKLKKVVTTTPEWEPVAILSLGYAETDTIPKKKRKPTDDIVCYNKW